MSHVNFTNDLYIAHMFELASRIVAESGVPADRYNIGKLILQGLKDHPDFVLQIDGGTDQSETSGSVMERSIRCALAFRRMGLKTGDVMVLLAPNHIDLAIPFYAALYLGVIIATDDKNLSKMELQRSFQASKPNIVFCQSEKADEVSQALRDNGLDSKIITFDEHSKYRNLSEIIKTENDVLNFRPANLDSVNSIAFLLTTSGTTGDPKMVAHSYKSVYTMLLHSGIKDTKFPSPPVVFMILSPIQWLSGHMMMLCSPFMQVTRLQTSKPITRDHVYELINKYKPKRFATSPAIMYMLLHPKEQYRCDFSCLESIVLIGSAVTEKLVQDIKKLMPTTLVVNTHGASEYGLIFFDTTGKCSGRPAGNLFIRLVNPDTGKDIVEPNVTGEIWVKGLTVFKEYYNNPKETVLAFTEDGWHKTGDLFYRDEYWNFYFVERIKLFLKYRIQQVSPMEIENVIRSHDNIVDVAVTGYPDEECGDLVTAFVVLREPNSTTSQDIKNIVKESLSDAKQLRGGVVFVDELPLTPTTKIDRKTLKRMVLSAKRE